MYRAVPLYILGASGLAREVAAYARDECPHREILFVSPSGEGENGITVQEYLQRARKGVGESVMGSGRCEVRRRMVNEIQPPFATIIHPAATVLGEVGLGSVIAPGAVIAPGSCIGLHVLVNYNATVGHDTVVDQLSVIGPGASVGGWCLLEEAVYVGAGALIRERLKVQHDAVIGMGAVVVEDIRAEAVAVGVPARQRDRADGGGRWLHEA